MDELEPEYNIDYFIKKFEDIPDEKWCMSQFVCYENGKPHAYCAYGLCGAEQALQDAPEAMALYKITHTYETPVVAVNDGYYGQPYKQGTPKARILAFLQDIKAGTASIF